MSEAEKRVSELLDRWLASLDLHSRYLKLDDAEYAKVQPWPKHQRPNRWIIDLARQRVGELRFHLKERREIGDDEFADALELMGFLTSLLATEHLERFVPLALPPKDATVREATLKPGSGTTATIRAPAPAKSTASRAAAPRSTSGRPVAARPATPAPRRAAASAAVQKAAPARASTQAQRQPAPAPRPAARPPVKLTEQLTKQIVADAVRLLDWGSEWPQLAGLIARLADRPSEKEIWGVLSAYRTTIEARAKPRRD